MHVKRIDATETIDYVIMSCISRKSVPPNVHFPWPINQNTTLST